MRDNTGVTVPARQTATRMPRARMTGQQRREQLLTVGKRPVVYEHFGGKEGLYAVVVDREIEYLLDAITQSLAAPAHPRLLTERAALALLDYIEQHTNGFRILVRDSPVTQSTGTFASLLSDVATQVEHLLAKDAPMYSQMLVGMVALTGQWWLDSRKPGKQVVAAHLVNLAWNGLSGLEPRPSLTERDRLVAGSRPGATLRWTSAVVSRPATAASGTQDASSLLPPTSSTRGSSTGNSWSGVNWPR